MRKIYPPVVVLSCLLLAACNKAPTPPADAESEEVSAHETPAPTAPEQPTVAEAPTPVVAEPTPAEPVAATPPPKPAEPEPEGTRTWRDPYGRTIRAVFVRADEKSITLNVVGKGEVTLKRTEFSESDLIWVRMHLEKKQAAANPSRPTPPVAVAHKQPDVRQIGQRRSFVNAAPDGSVLGVGDYLRRYRKRYKPKSWGKLMVKSDGTYSVQHTYEHYVPGSGTVETTATFNLDDEGRVIP